MSPVDLSDVEWATINADLPDVLLVCNRLEKWPYAEWISDFSEKGSIKVSSVCFRDAGEYLEHGRYALGQAVAVRKYYKDRSKAERDSNSVLADVRSRFYAMYVPLWLYSAFEHSLSGILLLFDATLGSGDYKASKQPKHIYSLLNGVRSETPPHPKLTEAIERLIASANFEAVCRLRNDWVHNEPPRIETILYDPSRKHRVNMDTGWKMIGIGGKVPPTYSWTEFINILKSGIKDVADFLDVYADEWENAYGTPGPNKFFFPGELPYDSSEE